MWDHKILRKINKQVKTIIALDETMRKLSDEELSNKTVAFKTRLAEGETLEDILAESFATIREVARRISVINEH